MIYEVTTYVELLLSLEKQVDLTSLSLAEKGYTSDEAANTFVFSDPFAFVVGLLFDQGVQSSRAWEAPLRLRERLGHLNIARIASVEESDIIRVVAEKPSLHRYPAVLGRYLHRASRVLVNRFGGRAANLWESSRSIQEVKANLMLLPGIGEKKANLGVLMLWRDFNKAFVDAQDLPLAVDVHLARILGRSGHFALGDGAAGLHRLLRGRSKCPPAWFGTILWLIGQRYCHESNPNCLACPLRSACEKNIEYAKK